MAFTRFYIDPPPFKPIPFGLFSVADVRDMNDSHWSGGGIEMENPYGCGEPGVATQPCEAPVTKSVFISPEYPEGDPMTVYAQYRCSGPPDFNSARDNAVKALAAGEERAIESAVMTQLLADADDITPGTAVGPVQGIGLLEGFWGGNGGPYQATLHLGRTAATLGWGVLDRHGNHLETTLGSLVSAGAGYFNVAYDDTDGSTWLVASGPIVVIRGVMQAHEPFFIQAPLDNTWVALAERTFAFATLCTPVKVKVALGGGR